MTDALLLDARMKQVLAATRSLGRAGLSVALADFVDGPLGMRAVPASMSRWAGPTAWLPDPNADPDAYAKELVALLEAHPVRVVIPAGDESIGSLRPWRRELGQQSQVALASEEALDLATNKERTLRVAQELRVDVPRCLPVFSVDDVPAVMAEIGYPAVVKPLVSWSREHRGPRLLSQEVVNEAEATAAARAFAARGVAAMAQQLVTGRREAVCLFRADGRVLAQVAMVQERATPVLGGSSVLRETVPLPADTGAASASLVEAMGLDGFSEVEFRRDDQGRAVLMEVNARLSGTVELGVRAGVNFPLMLWQWASNRPVAKADGYRSGVRLRWLAGDVNWLLENLRRPGRPNSSPACPAIRAFAGEFLRRDAYDYFDWRDLRPAWAELRRLLGRKSAAQVQALGCGAGALDEAQEEPDDRR